MTIAAKKILLTGATGYLGSRLLKTLIKAGHELFVLKRNSSNLNRISEYTEKIKIYNIDEDGVKAAFNDVDSYDCVIHAATCYGRSGETAVKITESNLLFPLLLLEFACKSNVEIFINVSTSLPRDLNKYSLSKKQFEEWGRHFSDLKSIKFANLIFEHFYGPGDAESKFTSYIFKNCVNNSPELNLTQGTQQRDFIYIDDAVSAFMTIFRSSFINNTFFQEYEIGSGETISIRDFVQIVKQLSKANTKLNFGVIPLRDNEVTLSRADIQKLKKLSWRPKVSIQEGIIKSLKGYNI